MRIRRYTKNRRGAGMVAYGLVVGLVAVGAMVAVERSGASLSGLMKVAAVELGSVNAVMAGGTGANACDTTGLQPGDACPSGEIYLGDGPADGSPLFAADSDLAERKAYDFNDILTGATDPDDGRSNAATLFAIDGETFPAAEGCAALAAHGHDDWYLPAENELHQIWTLRDKVPNLVMTTSWTESAYWSSTESTDYAASYIKFTTDGDGSIGKLGKSSNGNVRCLRR